MSESNIIISARARASHLAYFQLSQEIQILPLLGLGKVTMESHERNRKPRGPVLEGGHALITYIPMGEEVGLINRGLVTGARGTPSTYCQGIRIKLRKDEFNVCTFC